MTDVPPDLAFLQWLIDWGFRHPKPIPGGQWAALAPKIFTVAIQTGRIGDYETIDQNWCYTNEREAKAALDAWDGTGEPTGWHRHTNTGRRVSRSPDEIDENGNPVPIGVMYRRS